MCSSSGSYLLIWLLVSNNSVKPCTAKKNLRELPVSSVGYILGVLKSGQMKMNHIWPEYVKVGPGEVRDILRCGVGTHQYISRSHLSPSVVQSPGVGWDVGRLHCAQGWRSWRTNPSRECPGSPVAPQVTHCPTIHSELGSCWSPDWKRVEIEE